MTFSEFLKTNTVLLDGGMGTPLQEKGLVPGELPERWNLTHPDEIVAIHKAYFEAGSHVVSANTFGANSLKFASEELDAVVCAAVTHAKTARDAFGGDRYVALDIGPTGKLLKPLGDLDFEDAVSVFAETVKLGDRYGVDLILIETMNDAYETKAALLAARENSELPILVTNAYGADGKLMTGANPAAMVALLEGMGADAVGLNCSLGPKDLRGVVNALLEVSSVPLVVKPNAGLPRSENGKTVFDVSAEAFAREMADFVRAGVRVVGGCCGTTPEYICALRKAVEGLPPAPITDKARTVISSYTHAVEFGAAPILIGERINPTGKKRFKEALLAGDMDYILGEGIRQADKGVHVLDVNVGLPGIDEVSVLTRTVCELQAILSLPLQIDTSDVQAMEAALRRYNGKALINSVNGKAESMAAVFPLMKKYGGVAVALTLDENGIPDSAEGRVAIAKKILDTAASYGISGKDILFDPLAMTVSADGNAARVTLDSLRRIRTELSGKTSLGVSNVSFGLPARDVVNGAFFLMALENGLSAAIMNPHSAEMMKAYYAYNALNGQDPNCASYIAHADSFLAVTSLAPVATASVDDGKTALQTAILRGLKEQAARETAVLLEKEEPLTIVETEIIPALNTVGEGFEKKTVYLPQLLMSAEAAKAAFDGIKAHMQKHTAETNEGKEIFVLATVQGDIHDIGKNIVKLLLENYGFAVLDLGRDVAPEQIVETVVRHQAPLCGLSALMTTTVPAMEETIRQLRQKAPFCRVIVGGAVLTEEYARKIGADAYAKDAMGAVRYAESMLKKN